MSLNADEATTKPTLQTVLDRINVLGTNLQSQSRHFKMMSIRLRPTSLGSRLTSLS